MTPYSSLHVSSPQGMVLRTQAQPVSPLVASFPTLQDDARIPSRTKEKWKRAHPGCIDLVITQCSSVCFVGHKTSQRGGRRATGPGLLLFRPLQMTPTMDKAYKCARGVSRIHPKSSPSEKSNSSENSEKKSDLPLCLSRGQVCAQQGLPHRL